MNRVLIAAALWAASFAVPAATYYVREDGGSSSQCTGLADAAYDGAGTGEDCAFNTAPAGVSALSASDTLIIKNGTYSVVSAALIPPSGTASAPTRILGEHHANCRSKPEIWGSGGRSRIFDLSNRNYVELACLEITDHEDCLYEHYSTTHACNSGESYARDGVYAYNSISLVLRDLNIHGLAQNAFKGGKVNGMTIERVRMVGNGDAGFHGATNNADDSFTGTLHFKNVEIAWNGCAEDYPKLTIIACYSEIGYGYGDGLGTTDTSGTWLIEDSYVHHNTSDGLDLRYTKLAGATVTIRRSWFYNNAGNQVKVWGRLTMENSYVSSYCTFFGNRYGEAIDPDTGALATTPESCRADGTAIFVVAPPISGVGVTIRYSTITGNSLLMFHYHQEAGATSSSIARLENNVFIGQDAFDGSGKSFFVNDGNSTVQYYNNHVYNMRSGDCPAGSTCTSPLLRSQSITAFDPRPQASSPVLGAGNTSYTTPTTDITGRARPAAPARGAFEYAP